MDGQREGESADQTATASDFALRLMSAEPSRLATAAQVSVGRLHALIRELRPTGDEFRALVDFLTDVGHYSDARRQEWVLLADVLGVSTLIEDLNTARPAGATPNTVAAWIVADCKA